MNFATLQFRQEDGIGILTINRESALNALNEPVIHELNEFLNHVDADKSLKVLVITGAGPKAFVAGADIKSMQGFTEAQALEMTIRGQKVFQRIENLRIPSIAAVNGFALGGGFELALSCDFIIASENAKFGLPEVGLGLIPGYGGTQRLSRSVGKSVARFITLTGDVYSAQQAYEWGLVVRVCASSELMNECNKIAKTLSSRGPLAQSLAKQAINLGFDKAQSEGLQLEAELFAKTFSTKDQQEGIAAFIEKRKPHFSGE